MLLTQELLARAAAVFVRELHKVSEAALHHLRSFMAVGQWLYTPLDQRWNPI